MVITAIPAGFAAGLFGIGGGLITVPILFYIFGAAGIEPEYLMHLAVGTSFGIIIPTSIVSVLTHHQHNAVDFSVVKGYGVFVIIGVILGTVLAAGLKTKPLILFFTIVVFILAFYLLFLKEKESDLSIKMGLPAKIISVNVHAGTEVTAGTILVILEAMKIENPIRATKSGVVETVFFAEGDIVEEGEILLKFTPAEIN